MTVHHSSGLKSAPRIQCGAASDLDGLLCLLFLELTKALFHAFVLQFLANFNGKLSPSWVIQLEKLNTPQGPGVSVYPYPEKRNHHSFVNISPTLVIDTSMERSSRILHHGNPWCSGFPWCSTREYYTMGLGSFLKKKIEIEF